MNIFINAYNLYSGGGLTVGLGVIHALMHSSEEHRYVVAIPDMEAYAHLNDQPGIRLIRIKRQKAFAKLNIERKLANIVKQEGCDAILSFTNYALPANIPETLMLHWPYAVYPEKDIWKRMSMQNRFVRRLRLRKVKKQLRYADQLIVQTEVMKQRALQYLKVDVPIHVIPSAPGFSGDAKNEVISSEIEKLKQEGNRVFLCINEYYEHKNLEILLPLAREIKEKGKSFRFVITLEPGSNELLREIKSQQLDDIIVNVGRVPRHQTKALFQQCDALFFPSLIESFGIPLVEAMSVGLPVYTSDRDFAHAVCGDHAQYFDPLDVQDILRVLGKMPENKTGKPVLSWTAIVRQMIKLVE